MILYTLQEYGKNSALKEQCSHGFTHFGFSTYRLIGNSNSVLGLIYYFIIFFVVVVVEHGRGQRTVHEHAKQPDDIIMLTRIDRFRRIAI